VVEAMPELALVGLAATDEQAPRVVLVEKRSDSILPPDPVLLARAGSHPLGPFVGVGVDRPKPACGHGVDRR